MANHRIVQGMTTPQRLAAAWEKVIQAGERITVTEFARRAQISPHTLTHRYSEWATKCRARRDGASETTAPTRVAQRVQVSTWDEAEGLITSLRAENRSLKVRNDSLERERTKLGSHVQRTQEVAEENERLRGAIVMYQQLMRRHLASGVADSALRVVEEWVSNATSSK